MDTFQTSTSPHTTVKLPNLAEMLERAERFSDTAMFLVFVEDNGDGTETIRRVYDRRTRVMCCVKEDLPLSPVSIPCCAVDWLPITRKKM